MEVDETTPLLHPAEEPPRFAAGSLVSHPLFGVVRVVGLERRRLAGRLRDVYVLQMLAPGAEVVSNTPLDRLLDVPLRPLVTPREAEAIARAMASPVEQPRAAFELERALANTQRENQPGALAEVLREACSRPIDDVDGRSRALARLTEELALVLGRAPTELLGELGVCGGSANFAPGHARGKVASSHGTHREARPGPAACTRDRLGPLPLSREEDPRGDRERLAVRGHDR
jgi:RNA polymerase-interacting CarD/CdnL/TRCF family regulator